MKNVTFDDLAMGEASHTHPQLSHINIINNYIQQLTFILIHILSSTHAGFHTDCGSPGIPSPLPPQIFLSSPHKFISITQVMCLSTKGE